MNTSNPLDNAQNHINNIVVRESSLEAHKAIKPLKETHYKWILKTMVYIGKPSTSKDISKECVLDYHKVARRMSEMEKLGMVRVVGRCPEQPKRPLLWDIV